MIDLRQEDVNMFLKLEEDEPVSSNNDEEPKEDWGEDAEHRKNDLDEHILALHLHILRQLGQTTPHYYLNENEDQEENKTSDGETTDCW